MTEQIMRDTLKVSNITFRYGSMRQGGSAKE